MFKCEITKKMSKPHEKLNRITVQTRPMEYRHWDAEAEEVWYTQGSEIVREINASDQGVKMWNAMTPEERQEFVKRLS